MKTGILIGYFAKHDEALEAFADLKRKGYRRVAWVSKSMEGIVRTGDPFRRRLVWGQSCGLSCLQHWPH